MSSAALPCLEGLPALLLVEPELAHSVRSAQLSRDRFCVTQTDCALDLFMMRHTFRFTVAVLSDRIGIPFLCSAVENVRWQWPEARILILGRVPHAMNDQCYDDRADHAVDEDQLFAVLDKLTQYPWAQPNEALPSSSPDASLRRPVARAVSLRESDPAKFLERSSPGVHERDLPSGQYRSHRRGYYAFPPSS